MLYWHAGWRAICPGCRYPFPPILRRGYPLGSTREIFRQLGRLQGQEALEFSIRLIADDLAASFRHLPGVLKSANFDAIVLDELKTGLGLVPRHMGIPYIHVSSAIHLDYSGSTPLCVFDWPHDPSEQGLARNKAGLQGFMQAYEPVISVARSYSREIGADIDWSNLFATLSELAWITQIPAAFDFPSVGMPRQFHHIGPLQHAEGRIESNFPWHLLTGEPLIYASMGTLQNGLESVFSTIVEAVGARPGFQLVLSVGPEIDLGKIAPLPPNAVMVRYAPQLELLKRAHLCITHAGLNTTLESLAHGVPLVAIPVTNDQPGVAARIAHSETGLFVPLLELTVPKLRRLIDQLLSNPEYKRNAQKMGVLITKENKALEAAEFIERLIARVITADSALRISSRNSGRPIRFC